jgi:hypothetical protein
MFIYSVALMYPLLSWKLYFSPQIRRDIVADKDLSKYFILNVDRSKIKTDLLNYNIVL